jgi:putative RecB family exonuclease
MIAPAELPITPAPLHSPDRRAQLQQSVSASRLGLWQQCRLKFYFRYVLQIAKPPTPALHVGGVVHEVLKAWNLARWRKERFETEKFKALFDQQWQAGQEGKAIPWDPGEEIREKRQGWLLLETCFLNTPIKANERPEAVEVAVEADLSQHGLPTLLGILDLVRAGGRIVDFKTCSQTPNADLARHQHEIQTTSYAVLYRESTGHKEAGIELHHLVKLKTPKLVITEAGAMTDGQQTRLFKLIDSYVQGLARQDFVPAPGFHCAGCEFFQECRKWS